MNPPTPPEPSPGSDPAGDGPEKAPDSGPGPTEFVPFEGGTPSVDPNGQTGMLRSDLPPYMGQERPVQGPFRQGDRVGKYRILTKIAWGGFAVVYHARQEEGVARDVAIKVIRRDKADNPDILSRFRQEQQLLASLSHPNIVKVLEVGETSTGEPYCVMEYIRGQPLTTYCDEHRLPIRQRLELMIQVCEAVYYANRHGVIHRDISPSNILVAVHQGADPQRGVGVTPIVIDFNAAKWPTVSPASKPPVSQIGQLIGKLAYMSPEQMSPGGEELDERSDVYSLGVVLYELLVGEPPFPPEVLESGAIERAREIVRTRVPDKPSTALSAMGPRASEIATKRGAEINALAAELRGDFGEVPLMALEKFREHRYRNAREMADDLRRALKGESTVAGKFVFGVFVGKVLARYRPYLWAAGVVVVALGLSVVGLSVATAVAMRARDEARRQEYLANIAAADLAIRADQPVQAGNFLDACAPNLRGWEWSYLNRARDRSVLLWNPKAGGNIVTLGVDPTAGTVRAAETVRWLAIDPANPAAFASGGSRIRGKDALPETHVRGVDPTGKWALLLTRDGTDTWLLVDARSEELIRTLGVASGAGGGEERRPPFAVFSPDGGWLALTLRDDEHAAPKVHLVRLDRGVGEPVPLADAGIAAFSDDGKHIVVGDPTLTVFETGTMRVSRELARGADLGTPRTLALGGGGDVCAVATAQGVDLWRAGPGGPVRRSIAAPGAKALAFSPDGERLAAAVGLRVKLVRASDGSPVGELIGHVKPVTALAFSRSGTVLYSGTSGAGEVRAWRLSDVLPRIFSGGMDRAVAGRDAPLVAVISRGERNAPDVRLCRIADGSSVRMLEKSGSGVAMSKGGRRLATAEPDGPLRVWSLSDPRSAAVEWPLPAMEGSPHSQPDEYERPVLRWRPDDSAIVVLRSRMNTYRVDVISATDGRILYFRTWPWNQRARGGEGFVAMDLSPQDGSVAMALGTTLEVVGPDLRSTRWTAIAPTNPRTLAWDPSGERVAVGLINGDVMVMEAGAGGAGVLRHIGSHAGQSAVQCAVWTGDRLLTGGGDGNIIVWDTGADRAVLTIPLNARVVSVIEQGGGVLAALADGRVVTLPSGLTREP